MIWLVFNLSKMTVTLKMIFWGDSVWFIQLLKGRAKSSQWKIAIPFSKQIKSPWRGRKLHWWGSATSLRTLGQTSHFCLQFHKLQHGGSGDLGSGETLTVAQLASCPLPQGQRLPYRVPGATLCKIIKMGETAQSRDAMAFCSVGQMSEGTAVTREAQRTASENLIYSFNPLGNLRR